MKLTLEIWRQKNKETKGKFETYEMDEVSEDMSFLEMLDVLNNDLIREGKDPVEFDHDCREGICGSCNMVVNGRAHGPHKATTVCQLHMRSFNDGDKITIEPWRAKAFPVIKDLVVDRSSFDRIMSSGGYISVNTGGTPDANEIPIPKDVADEAFNAATCIGCGACVAACPNASAMLFVSAKIAQLAMLPQGKVERNARAKNMITQMDDEDFGGCTNIGACSEECPKEIDLVNIARMNKEYFSAALSSE